MPSPIELTDRVSAKPKLEVTCNIDTKKMENVACSNNVEAQHVEMRVPLYSYGCEKKIKKSLSHLRGIHSINVDYHTQKVTVWGICNKDEVLATIRKKRRDARFWDDQTAPSNGSTADETNATDEVASSGVSRLESLSSHKFRKSWKRLFPIVM